MGLREELLDIDEDRLAHAFADVGRGFFGEGPEVFQNSLHAMSEEYPAFKRIIEGMSAALKNKKISTMPDEEVAKITLGMAVGFLILKSYAEMEGSTPSDFTP